MGQTRRSKRLVCAVPVDSAKKSPFSESATVDISKGGLGFVSHRKIPLNTKIAFELILSLKEEPVLAIGKVKWVRPIPDSKNYRVGISFENILDGSKSRLTQYFRK